MSEPEYFVIKRETCPECGEVEITPPDIFGEYGTVTTIQCGKCVKGVLETKIPLVTALIEIAHLSPNATIDSLTIEPRYSVGKRHPD